jgi:hypothetical protein
MVGDTAQVGMLDHRPIGLPAPEFLAGHEQSAIRQPFGGPPEARGTLSYDLAVALEINGNDLLGTPVGEPQTPLVPTRQLADR